LVPFTKKKLTEVDKRTYKKAKAEDDERYRDTSGENTNNKEKLMMPWVVVETTVVFTIVLLKQNIAERCVIMQQSKF